MQLKVNEMKRGIRLLAILSLIITACCSACSMRNEGQRPFTDAETPLPTDDPNLVTDTIVPTTEATPTPELTPQPTATPTIELTQTPIPPVEIFGQLSEIYGNQGEQVSISIDASNYTSASWFFTCSRL